MNSKFNSSDYWERRYSDGRMSGDGSYGKLAIFKAEVINNFIGEHDIISMLDFGCGDGNQASFFNCQEYIGYDVSKTAIELCKKKFATNTTRTFTNSIKNLNPVDLTLSCEVLFHLVGLDIFMQYLQKLFELSNRFVIIYSSNSEASSVSYHIKHRNFTLFVLKYFPKWKLIKKILNKYSEECFSDFYIYEMQGE